MHLVPLLMQDRSRHNCYLLSMLETVTGVDNVFTFQSWWLVLLKMIRNLIKAYNVVLKVTNATWTNNLYLLRDPEHSSTVHTVLLLQITGPVNECACKSVKRSLKACMRKM